MKTTAQRKRERKTARLEKHWGPDGFVEWCKTMNCVVTGQSGVELHHVKSRGSGGTWKDIVPLSPEKHRELHRIGVKSFEERYTISLRAKALLIHGWWLSHEAGEEVMPF